MGERTGRRMRRCSRAAVPVCLRTITVCVPRMDEQCASRSVSNLPSHYRRSSCWKHSSDLSWQRLLSENGDWGKNGGRVKVKAGEGKRRKNLLTLTSWERFIQVLSGFIWHFLRPTTTMWFQFSQKAPFKIFFCYSPPVSRLLSARHLAQAGVNAYRWQCS